MDRTSPPASQSPTSSSPGPPSAPSPRVTTSDASADWRMPLAAGLDTAAVVLFVAIGRKEHEQGSAIGGLIHTVAPFLIALAVAWLALRVWRNPTSWRMGIGIVAIVVVGGMVLRNLVFGGGTATSFIIVTTLFLTLFIVGWRLVLAAIDRRRARR